MKSPVLGTWSFKKIHRHNMIFPNTRRSACRRPFSREAIQTSGIFTGVRERQSVCAGIDYCHCMSASSHDSGVEGKERISLNTCSGEAGGQGSATTPSLGSLSSSPQKIRKIDPGPFERGVIALKGMFACSSVNASRS